MTLTGVPGLVSGAGAGLAPPFAPLRDSPAGTAIQAAIGAIAAEIQSFGIAFTAGLPLPGEPADSAAIDRVLTEPEFGYGASPLTPARTPKVSGLGDIELGLRFGLAQSDAVRAVLGATIRLPTSKRDDPANFLDIPNGDHQTDLVWTLDAALEPGGPLGVWLSAAYTLQLADRIDVRIAPPTQPLALASTAATVDRNLGEILRVSVHPSLRLAADFRAFVSAAYERKWSDKVTRGGATVPELEMFTERQHWAFGAGLLYRVDQRAGGASTLPVEASLNYQAAFFGTGGATPKVGRFALSLRLFYNLWGREPAPGPAPATEQR
jgi:hypothetical protein